MNKGNWQQSANGRTTKIETTGTSTRWIGCREEETCFKILSEDNFITSHDLLGAQEFYTVLEENPHTLNSCNSYFSPNANGINIGVFFS